MRPRSLARQSPGGGGGGRYGYASETTARAHGIARRGSIRSGVPERERAARRPVAARRLPVPDAPDESPVLAERLGALRQRIDAGTRTVDGSERELRRTLAALDVLRAHLDDQGQLLARARDGVA